MDQRALVERAKRGDHDAFAVLVDGIASRQLGAARLIVRDLELAHDATQDALVRAWRDLPGLREPDRFDAWLHRLTVNACLDLLRRRRRRATEIQIEDLDLAGPSDPAAGIADRDALDQALARLDVDARAVVVLHYYLGLPISEVAVALGIPAGTVKSRLNRSLTSMRTEISGARRSAAASIAEGQLA
jgi:RNA polymerase sigma-70 factor (ECF subfamily)